MLPRASRLISDYDFRRVRRFGRQFGSPFFSLYLLREKSPLPSRFGFVVSTKVEKRATRRNRVKRIFRDEVAKLLPQTSPGILGAFWVKGFALEVPPDKVRASIREVLQKAGIIE